MRFLNYIKERKALCLFLVTFLILMSIYLIHPILYGSLGYDFSDGTVQYREYIRSFYDTIKSGAFSDYNINNFYGNSFYALTYYIPFDIFGLVMFLLSFINFEFAFTFTRLLIILAGVMLFYYTTRKITNFSDKTALILSLLYLASGSFSIYKVYFSFLGFYFYVPLVILGLYYSHEKKLHSFLLGASLLTMLFNFYLGYMIIISDVVIYFVIKTYNRDSSISFKKYFKDEIKLYLIDGIFVLLGVFTTSVILIPSLLYLMSVKIVDRHFAFSFSLIYETLIRCLIPTEEANFFYLKDANYIIGQRSLYITSFGILSIINYIGLNKKDLKKNIILILTLVLLVAIPAFSFIFNASFVNYGRWYFLITVINLYLIGKNLEEDGIKLSFFDTSFKKYVVLTPYILMLVITFILDALNEISFSSGIYIILMLMISIYLIFSSFKWQRIRKYLIAFEIVFATFISSKCEAISSSNYVKLETNDMKFLESFRKNNPDDTFYKTYISYSLSDKTNIGTRSESMTNEGIMFSSFYDTATNDYLKYYEGFNNIDDSWYAMTKLDTNFASSLFFNYKYVMVEKSTKYKIEVPSFYRLIDEDKNNYYYINEKETGFATVYYKCHNNLSENINQNINTLGWSCYYENANEQIDYSDTKIYDLCLKKESFDDLQEFKGETYLIPNEYFKEGKLYSSSFKILTVDENNNYKFYLNNSFIYTKEIKRIYFVNYYPSTYDYYNFALYESNPEEERIEAFQTDAKYENGAFKINYQKELKQKAIIALPIAYSTSFKSNYETIKVNGGFMGVIIPEDEVGDINVFIKYEAKGSKIGIIISLIFAFISLGYTSYEMISVLKEKNKLEL